MNAEAVMRNLSLLDSLWDGMQHQVRRRTSDSFELINARLTIGLQVQPAAFRAFYEKTGGISRGIGFLARCLLSWPTSTQGSRTFSEPPEAWPGLHAFRERITALLNFPLSFDESGHLSIPVIALNPSAKDSWIAFHNEVESMLVDGQMLADIRDVGSKAADNAARLACLFQIFESGVTKVGVVAMENAIRIVRWHLKEARRFLLHMEQAEELVDAERLRQWLTNYVRTSRQTSVDKNHVLQFGPLRSSSRLSPAITELEDQGVVTEMKHGRRTIIVIHKESAYGD
jgi:putative DNA primase/helicase